MSEKKWGFFPFDAMDYKAAQNYLDKKAADGWVMDKLYLKWFARFVPAEERYHCVDLDIPHVFDDDLDWTYVEFCEGAGWELVTNIRSMLVFRTKLGHHPAPLQTDTELEAEKFWKKHVRRNFLIELIFLLFLVLLIILLHSLHDPRISITELLCSNAALLGIPYLLFAAVSLFWTLYRTIVIYVQFRHTREIAKQKRTSAWVIGLLSFLMKALLILWYVLYLAEGLFIGKVVDVAWSTYSDEYTATPELCQSYPVITAADLGLPYSEDSRYLDGRRALLAERLEYSEITDNPHHILTTERYECTNKKVAQWMFDARKDETARGSGFLWGELEWGEVTSAHGFDQLCFTRDNSYLLAQEGDTVVLVGATGFDLTEHLDTLCERLGLDE